jgi:hypothetical protein
MKIKGSVVISNDKFRDFIEEEEKQFDLGNIPDRKIRSYKDRFKISFNMLDDVFNLADDPFERK